MERYDVGQKLGAGTYGVVTGARDKKTGRQVAIKKIRMGKHKDGVNFTALREIKILQELKHKNVVELVDVFERASSIYLVFEYLETDLETVIMDKSINLSPMDIKSYMKMLLEAVDYCHKNWVLHRDLKPNNLLFDANGDMKLADFGLARTFGSPNRQMTIQVITRWYRPPELLFGAREYSGAVDIWSVGCIFAELMLRKAYFPGESDIDQLCKIFHVLGTPNDENWPGASALPNYLDFREAQPAPDMTQYFTAAPPEALELLGSLLQLDPSRRPTAEEALKHAYFTTGPAPTPPSELPRPVPPERVAAAADGSNTKP